MKIKRLFLLGLTAVFAAACVQEQAENPQAALPGGEVIEAGTAPATKTYADVPDVLWAEGDCITAYMGTNAKGTYKLTEGAGTTYGKFTKVNGSLTGDPIDANYAIYSYNGEGILDKGKIQVDLPGTQTFVDGSFGPGANTMVAVSDDNVFYFQNVGGYFVIPVTGNVTVKSITVKGGGEESLAGRAIVSLGEKGPEIEEIRRSLNEVKVVCEEPVVLDEKEPAEFWFVLPPTRFTMGMTVTVEYNDGETMEFYPSAKSFAISRSEVYRMDPIDVHKSELTIKRLWGKYPNSGWPTDYLKANEDRCVATDGEWIYVAQASASAGSVVAISVADPSVTKEVNMTGVEGGFFKTSCVRTIWDPQSQKYILLLSNMVMDSGTKLCVYTYENGVDAAPTKVVENTIWGNRRFGDFFTVVGDWSKGYLYFRNNNATDPSVTARFNIEGGKVTNGDAMARFDYGYGGSKGMGSFYLYSVDAKQGLLVTDAIGMFFPLNSQTGLEWTNGDDYSVWSKKFGITPFEYEGVKYIAYHNMYNAARGWLRIINDVNGTADGFMETLIKNDVVFEGAVQIEKDEATTEVVSGATYSGNTMGNCSVAYVDGGVIIVSHQQNTGIAVFKMAME